jgi:hypothetical protein
MVIPSRLFLGPLRLELERISHHCKAGDCAMQRECTKLLIGRANRSTAWGCLDHRARGTHERVG